MTTTNPVFDAAFIRGALLAGLTGAVTTLTSKQQGLSWEDALIAGAVILITTLIARTGLEGTYDANRARTNNVNAGDVPMAADGITVTKP